MAERVKISRNQTIGVILVISLGIFSIATIVLINQSSMSGCQNPKPTSSTATMVGNTHVDTYYSASVFAQSFTVPTGRTKIMAIYINTKSTSNDIIPDNIYIDIVDAGQYDEPVANSPIHFRFVTIYADFVKNCWFNITSDQLQFVSLVSGTKYVLWVHCSSPIGNAPDRIISVGASKSDKYYYGRLSELGGIGIDVGNNMGLGSNFWQFPLAGLSDMGFQICFT